MPSQTTKHLECDIAIIGGGAGGLSVAAGAAQLGAHVVLVESGKMGGDCLNVGCVPSKSLLAAGKALWQAQHSQDLGVDGSAVKGDFQAAMKHVHHVIDNIAEHDSVERFEKLGVTVIQAPGEFIDPNTLKAGEQTIKAKRYVIATGSSAFVPPIPGIDGVPYLTNETIFDLKEQPDHLIVIGGGAIGAELSQAFAMLGTRVTLLEGFTILPKDESDCVEVVRQSLKDTGIALHENVKVNGLAKDQNEIVVTCEGDGKTFDVKGSHVLVATGRRPNVKGLGCEAAAIECSPKGIAVDKRLRTSNKRVYAIGDVTGPYPFTHMASYHAGVIIKNCLFRMPAKVDYRGVAWVTYTSPELAHAGMLISEAKDNGINFKITEWPYTENDRAQADNQTQGKIKIITTPKGKILGATIVGAHAGELIMPWIMAVQEGQKLSAFTNAIVPYPTLSELSKRVAGAFYTPLLFSAKTRTLVKWLLKLG